MNGEPDCTDPKLLERQSTTPECAHEQDPAVETREQRLERLRHAYESGTYSTTPAAVALKIVKDALNES